MNAFGRLMSLTVLAMAGGSCGSTSRAAGQRAQDAGLGDAPASDAAGSMTEMDNPTIPIGFDAYRLWARWPYLHIAERAYMRSTYDRAGGNEAADASHFLRVTADRAVPFDVAGPGVLQFSPFFSPASPLARQWASAPVGLERISLYRVYLDASADAVMLRQQAR